MITEMGEHVVFASVSQYYLRMKTIELHCAAIMSLYNNKDGDSCIDIDKITIMKEEVDKVISFILSEIERVSNMPNFKWWLWTVKYDHRRKWVVPKDVYNLFSSKYKAYKKCYGNRTKSIEQACSRQSFML